MKGTYFGVHTRGSTSEVSFYEKLCIFRKTLSWKIKINASFYNMYLIFKKIVYNDVYNDIDTGI